MGRLKVAVLGALVLALLVFGMVGAQDQASFETSGLLVYDVWVRPTAGELVDGATPQPPIPGTTTGAYMTIHNTSAADYQLVAVSSDAAEMTHVHETTVEGDIARMRMIGTVDIPAGETVMLAPMGLHAMLMNVTRDLHPGEAVALTLTFSDANGAEFDVPVAALATDFMLADETLIVANAAAVASDGQTLDVTLLVDNRGSEAETLTAVTSSLAATTSLLQLDGTEPVSYTSVELAPQQSTLFSPDGVFIRLSQLDRLPDAPFTLTLEFESGKFLTVAVPVIEGQP